MQCIKLKYRLRIIVSKNVRPELWKMESTFQCDTEVFHVLQL